MKEHERIFIDSVNTDLSIRQASISPSSPTKQYPNSLQIHRYNSLNSIPTANDRKLTANIPIVLNNSENLSDVSSAIIEVKRLASDPVTNVEKKQAKNHYSKLSHDEGYIDTIYHFLLNNRVASLVDLMKNIQLKSEVEEEQKFNCGICFDEYSKSDLYFSQNSCQVHANKYCKVCIKAWINLQIDDGIVLISCPGSNNSSAAGDKKSCNGYFSIPEISYNVSDEQYNKYIRFRMIKQNPSYRECPECNHGETIQDIPKNSLLTCSRCTYSYCFLHGNAHPSMTCEQYYKKLGKNGVKELKLSENLIKKTTRPCPNCKAPTQRIGGCHHVRCHMCQIDWCWLCSRQIDDVTVHYLPGNISGCPGSQFATESSIRILGYDPMILFRKFVKIPLRLFIFSIICIFVFVMIVVPSLVALPCTGLYVLLYPPMFVTYEEVFLGPGNFTIFFIVSCLALCLEALWIFTMFPLVCLFFLIQMCFIDRSISIKDKMQEFVFFPYICLRMIVEFAAGIEDNDVNVEIQRQDDVHLRNEPTTDIA